MALTLFVGSHFLPRLWGLRERLTQVPGRRVDFSLYGLLSLALLAWVVAAAGRAPYVEVWPQVPWMRWAPLLAMPFAVVLVTCGAGLRQPFTLGGRRNAAPDPAAAVTRHPLVLALVLWAGAHLVPNGDLAHVILFGSFTIMALAAIPAFEARARRAFGAQVGAFFAATSILSLRPLADRRWLRANPRAQPAAGVGGVVWLGLLHLHEPVIGMSPFPV